jgi:hypothetical protein
MTNNIARAADLMRRHILLLVLATLACDSDPARPDPEPADVIVTAQVNVQLGDTPAGQEPAYIVTGQVIATQDGVRVTAFMDSVVIRYRIADGPFIRHARRTSVPFSDELPFTATAGQTYGIRAIMYATGTGTNATATGTDEWVATGIGTP